MELLAGMVFASLFICQPDEQDDDTWHIHEDSNEI
jgi:hypothetical protein